MRVKNQRWEFHSMLSMVDDVKLRVNDVFLGWSELLTEAISDFFWCRRTFMAAKHPRRNAETWTVFLDTRKLDARVEKFNYQS